jgi:hypothetical protein
MADGVVFIAVHGQGADGPLNSDTLYYSFTRETDKAGIALPKVLKRRMGIKPGNRLLLRQQALANPRCYGQPGQYGVVAAAMRLYTCVCPHRNGQITGRISGITLLEL